ncbi:MAG: hypothetical protein IPL26_30200 [Leptospiraceae bacterium]|nr:hypothetical protein [Leptospiraceae bacterium]
MNQLIIATIILLLTLDIQAKSICKNPDVLIYTKKGFYFSCGKIAYSKKQAIEINSKLYKTQTMVIKLSDRKLNIRFNHYKIKSYTQILNEEELAKISQLLLPEVTQ